MGVSIKPLTLYQQSLICQAAVYSDDKQLEALDSKERRLVAQAFKSMENLWNKEHKSFEIYTQQPNDNQRNQIQGLLKKLSHSYTVPENDKEQKKTSLSERIFGVSSKTLIQKKHKFANFVNSKRLIENEIGLKKIELQKLLMSNERLRFSPEVLLEDFAKGLNRSKRNSFFLRSPTQSVARSLQDIEEKIRDLLALLINQIDPNKEVEALKKEIDLDRENNLTDADEYIEDELKKAKNFTSHQLGIKDSILILMNLKRELEGHVAKEMNRVMEPYKETIDLSKIKKEFLEQMNQGNDKQAMRMIDGEIKRIESKIKEQNKQPKHEGSKALSYLTNTITALKSLRKITSPSKFLKSKMKDILDKAKTSRRYAATNDRRMVELNREIGKLEKQLRNKKL